MLSFIGACVDLFIVTPITLALSLIGTAVTLTLSLFSCAGIVLAVFFFFGVLLLL